ncbi:hypothetical protein [Sabulicella glaciei]|uniref:Uncharacterized protein n=1 Tax=Sabulicella glaciei TaxID=2984948 RepID=A0ABT3NVX5_9PROT|nr:hypothetical protein [Roseococcus sp. MDT2-1-1]MCW8086307.1 hypothetical protein [Roseococcus sp. MDT2-1-1]
MVTTEPLPGGALRHEVAVAADALPPVSPQALEAAWEVARAAADAGLWGPARLLVFADADPIALTDPDAACWAEAMAQHVGLDTLGGLALCLRLLALVEVMGRASWLRGFFAIGPEGAEFHPALLAAAARAPLDATGRFADAALRGMLSRSLPA